MKKLLILALFLWALPAYSQTTINGRVQTGTNALKPATCSAGDQYNAVDTFQILVCGPANTWVAQGGGSVTGSGTTTQVAFWSSPSGLSSDSNFVWDNTKKQLNMGNPGALPAFFNSIKTQQSTMQCSATYNAGTGQQYCMNLMGHTTNGNTTSVIWATGVADGATDSNMMAFEGDHYAFPPIGITYTFNGNHVGYTENDGPGTVTDLYGSLQQFGTLNGATSTNSESFWAIPPQTATGHGTTPNAYGFRAAALGAYGSTLNAAFRADDQGTNAKSFSFYSAGGQNRFIESSGQTLPVVDVVSANPTTPYGGAVVVRGDGLGMVPIEGETALFEIVQHDSNSVGFVLSSGDAPAGNSMDITMAADGHANCGDPVGYPDCGSVSH